MWAFEKGLKERDIGVTFPTCPFGTSQRAAFRFSAH
jgi:hypothetical protein